jgi:hypothetical protein
MSDVITKKRRKIAAKRPVRGRSRAETLSPTAAVAIATSAKKSIKERVAAMARVGPAVCEKDNKLQAILKILRDTNEPTPVRLAALQALQAASFAAVQFESCRPDYLATLRAVATDPDAEIRQRVLGILARRKDGFAQQRLLEGLQQPEKALVPPEKALQLLGYDLHAEAYPIARALVNNPPSEAVKREALRLLAADASSKPLFERILRDKDETKEIRQLSASALQSIAPETLQTHAREIVLDPRDYDDIQATSLTALTQFGSAAEVGQDKKLMKLVGSLKTAASSKLKQGARHFLTKYSV